MKSGQNTCQGLYVSEYFVYNCTPKGAIPLRYGFCHLQLIATWGQVASLFLYH